LQPKSEALFCVKIAQKRTAFLPNWLPNEKIIGQVHLMYHIHHDDKKFRQTARRETGIGLGSMLEPRFVCDTQTVACGFSRNHQTMNTSGIEDCARRALGCRVKR
jgi:hypothetical protein